MAEASLLSVEVRLKQDNKVCPNEYIGSYEFIVVLIKSNLNVQQTVDWTFIVQSKNILNLHQYFREIC